MPLIKNREELKTESLFRKSDGKSVFITLFIRTQVTISEIVPYCKAVSVSLPLSPRYLSHSLSSVISVIRVPLPYSWCCPVCRNTHARSNSKGIAVER